MKILYVITSTETGGAETALAGLVRSVSQHTVKVISLKPVGSIGLQLAQEGVDVVSLQMKGAGLGTVSQLSKIIQQFEPDIVHALLFRAIEFSRLQKPLWMRWLDRTLKGIDSVSTAESVSTYNYLITHQHYRQEKTIHIGNSVGKSQFFKDNSLKKSMRQTQGFAENDCIFISVARLAPVKNPQGLLRAFEKILPNCPQAKLVYVGEGEERNALEKLINEKNLSQNVFLVGEQKNINDWLNMADVFVLFSKEESLPLALLEAQQAGLPCIVSKVGDMPKQVEHGKTGFVCNPGDEMLLACLLTELYENASLRQEMGSHALQKSATIVDSSQQYQQLYQHLISK